MRRLSKTITLVGTTALTCAIALTAHAHDGAETPATTVAYDAPLFERHTPLNAAVYEAFLDAKLAKVAALAEATRAKVAAIRGDEVLTGMERRVAKLRLARATKLAAMLDALPDSGVYAPTAAQRTRIAAIRADLDAIVAKLTRLLANRPAPTPSTRPSITTGVDKSEVAGTSDWWRKGCRGWDGVEDGEHRWDGWRDSAWRG